jgi:hypothetical protein
METLNTHFLLTVYILYKRTKFPSNMGISHKISTEECLSNPIMNTRGGFRAPPPSPPKFRKAYVIQR